MAAEIPGTPEASQPTVLDIPDLNVWRWQAERVATHLTEDSELGFRVARFFDDVEYTQFDLKDPNPGPPETEEDLIRLMAATGIVPDTQQRYNPRKLITFLSDCLALEPAVGLYANNGARITDYDLFRQRLDLINIKQFPKDTFYGTPVDRSEAYKAALIETLELTLDGFLRTAPPAEPTPKHALIATVAAIDFSQRAGDQRD